MDICIRKKKMNKKPKSVMCLSIILLIHFTVNENVLAQDYDVQQQASQESRLFQDYINLKDTGASPHFSQT
jgi:hypothetical protein